MASKPKSIVICLDGTGNKIQDNLSNVLKLYRILRSNHNQVTFYDQGVGTLEGTSTWGARWQSLLNVLGLAFGLGLDANVLKAYEFLIDQYQQYVTANERQYDKIFIFGFSRGAHTARVLAGLIYEIGILHPEQKHLAGAALIAYKKSMAADGQDDFEDKEYEGSGLNFRRIMQPRTAAIHFLGLFDTVSSVFVPNPKGIFPPLVREPLPHMHKNPAVQHFRHAVSIDEKRRMFRLDPWEKGQEFKPGFHSTGEPEKQTYKQVYFAGYHSDVGGGLERKGSGISQFPLIWMLDEAQAVGMKKNKRMADYVTGIKPYTTNTKHLYPKPDPSANIHDSMKWYWKPVEYLPKNEKFKEWPDRKVLLGYYLPLSEPRLIADNADIHPSVSERMEAVPTYRPINLPESASERARHT